MRKAVLALCVVGLMGVAAWAALDAPANFTATVGGTDVVFDWDDVLGATKYSVDVDAAVTYTIDGIDYEASGDLSYGTSDRTDGLPMAQSDLTVAQATIIADVFAALTAQGIDVSLITGLTIDALASAKALNAGKGAGAQNNPFSAPDDFQLTWTAP